MHGSRWRGLETERTYCVTAPAPDPIAGARRQVAHGDRQAGVGGQGGQFGLPQRGAVAVGAAAIGGDQQQPGRLRVAGGAGGLPPAADRSTANAAVSWSVPTLTEPVSAATS